MNSVKETAYQLFIEQDNSCAEAVLKGACRLYELPLSEDLVKVIGSFAGGCGVGDLCGACAGGLAAIGLKYGNGCLHKCEEQREKMKAFMNEFSTMFHSTDCEKIKAEFRKEDVRCLEVVEKTLGLIGLIFDQKIE
ncbi:MAG: C-GCAxxG-C-C family protein [Clostridia bacterium]|nr:C-GCAxxG-C-C family protein [Clostridia bacterium]MBQ6934844.1 C-GCAxxG-C-C family protein [Clostridia bacterium]